MAQQGDSTISAFDLNIDGRISGMEFVMPATFTLNFIRANLMEDNTANAHTVGAAVYQGNTLIATSNVRNDIALGSYANYDFTFSSGVTGLAAGTYRFVLLADPNVGGLLLGTNFSAGTSVTDDNVFATPPAFPNPADLVAANFNDAVLIDYTEGGANPGQPWQRQGGMGVQVSM